MLDVGCGDGDLLQLLESRGIDGRGIELSREGVNRCVAKGLAVVQGDADTDLVNYPDDAFDYVILSQTLQATRQPQGGAGKPAADRPPRHRVVSEFRLLADAAAASDRRPHAAHGEPAGDLVRHAEHSFLHHQGFRAALRRDQRQDGARGRARSLRPAAAAQRALVVLEHVRRAGRVFAEPGGEGEISCSRRQSFGDVIADPQRIGDDRQGRVYRADRRKEARIGHIQIVDPVRLAVEIENRLAGIGAEPQRAGLVGGAADRHVLAEIKRALKQMRMNVQFAG